MNIGQRLAKNPKVCLPVFLCSSAAQFQKLVLEEGGWSELLGDPSLWPGDAEISEPSASRALSNKERLRIELEEDAKSQPDDAPLANKEESEAAGHTAQKEQESAANARTLKYVPRLFSRFARRSLWLLHAQVAMLTAPFYLHTHRMFFRTVT